MTETPSPAGEADSAPQDADTNQPATAALAEESSKITVICRYGHMRHVGEFRSNLTEPPAPGTKVVVRTDRGVELAKVVAGVCENGGHRCLTPQRLNECIEANGPDYPFRRQGKLLRLANPQDVIDYRHLEGSAKDAANYSRRHIAELHLDMKLVAVEHLLGGERIIFYFTAESRVDFRELVRKLADEYRTRIEMRQVGARDEARILADYERCGRRCCCQAFLKDLKPVSMRMAKTQKATLDPSKIAGRCGRLMCCLRYEDASYEELRKNLPNRNIWVRTEELIGRVVNTQILTQLVQIALPDDSRTVIANADIIERNVEPPPPPTPRETKSKRPNHLNSHRNDAQVKADQSQAEPPAEPQATEATEKPQSNDAPQGAPTEQPSGPARRGKKRRRRRGGGGKGNSSVAQASAGGASARPDANAQGGGKASGQKRPNPRRNRRRRNKPSDQ